MNLMSVDTTAHTVPGKKEMNSDLLAVVNEYNGNVLQSLAYGGGESVIFTTTNQPNNKTFHVDISGSCVSVNGALIMGFGDFAMLPTQKQGRSTRVAFNFINKRTA